MSPFFGCGHWPRYDYDHLDYHQTVPWTTALAVSVGALEEGGTLAAMNQGGCPLTYIFTQIFTQENIPGLIVIAAIYAVCMVFAVRHSKARAAEIAAEEAEA